MKKILWLLIGMFLSTGLASKVDMKPLGYTPIACPKELSLSEDTRCFATSKTPFETQGDMENQFSKKIWNYWGYTNNYTSLTLTTKESDDLETITIRSLNSSNYKTLIDIRTISPLDIANGALKINTTAGSLVNKTPTGVYTYIEAANGSPLIDYSKIPPGFYKVIQSTSQQSEEAIVNLGTGEIILNGIKTIKPIPEERLLDSSPPNVAILLLDNDKVVKSLSGIKLNNPSVYVSQSGYAPYIGKLPKKGLGFTYISMPVLTSINTSSQESQGSYNNYPSSSGSSGGSVYVHSYYRSDGTYVHSHTRSAPGSKK